MLTPWSVAVAVRVPREAYKLDFVFHSGEVYENNAGQDFFVAVEGGLDAASFAAWVARQKREEQRRQLQEKEAAERVERERRRVEEEHTQDARDREAAAAGEPPCRHPEDPREHREVLLGGSCISEGRLCTLRP